MNSTCIPNRAVGLPTSSARPVRTRRNWVITPGRPLGAHRGVQSNGDAPDVACEDAAVEFATIPFELPFSQLLQMVKQAVGEFLPLAQAVEELRRHGHAELPQANGTPMEVGRRSRNRRWRGL